MVIKNRLFPYPVLADDTDDYREGSFEVEPKIVGETDNDFEIRFEIDLSNPGIKHYIDNNKAEYVIHIECSLTSYRDVINTSSDVIGYHLEKNRISGYVNLLAMVVAKEDIHFYRNVSLDRDYDDVDIHFPKGSILAYYNMPRLNVYKQYEELSSGENIFVLSKHERASENEHNIVTYNIYDHKIRICVDDDIYTAYVKMNGIPEMKHVVLTSLVFPALIYLVEQLRESDTVAMIEKCEEYKWFKQLNDYYRKDKKSLMDVVEDRSKSITEIAQELLDKPINRLFADYSI